METKFTVTRRYRLYSYIKKFVTKRIYKSVIRKSNCSYLKIVGFSSFQFPYNFSLFFHLLQQLFIDFVSHNAWFGLSPFNSNSKRFMQHGITAPSSRLHPTIVLRFTVGLLIWPTLQFHSIRVFDACVRERMNRFSSPHSYPICFSNRYEMVDNIDSFVINARKTIRYIDNWYFSFLWFIGIKKCQYKIDMFQHLDESRNR